MTTSSFPTPENMYPLEVLILVTVYSSPHDEPTAMPSFPVLGIPRNHVGSGLLSCQAIQPQSLSDKRFAPNHSIIVPVLPLGIPISPHAMNKMIHQIPLH